ncbi:hypothetical protein RRG08_047529 [Elysia crispata]|uniref:Uncharacterized protein n=1 Tax=Elysia crispata TaxID=231223 RepID=A0AAE0YP63_9GAST|nr:hypothetical protein RRG08_047529 [Elysia crispata]
MTPRPTWHSAEILIGRQLSHPNWQRGETSLPYVTQSGLTARPFCPNSGHYSKTRCLHGYSALGVQSFTVSRLGILICELIRTAIDLFRVSSPCGGLSLWCEVFMETKDWTQTVPVTGVG